MRERGTTIVNKGELSKLPYLTHVPDDGRMIPLQTYYDHSENCWRTWIVANKKLQEIRVINLCDGTYVSEKPVSPNKDYRIPFAEIVMKHFCTPEIFERTNQATQDLINCLGYIEKYFILLNHNNKYKDADASVLIQIELEGIFGVHRSFYDLLQRIVNEMHQRYSKQKISIPDSFRRVVEKEPDELAKKYHFPDPLIQFYQEKKALFLACRQIRDNIFHHGHSSGTIFCFNDGFAVGVDEKPWSTLTNFVNLWPKGKLRDNNVGCVLGVFALIAEDMFKTMAWLGDAIIASFPEPPEASFDLNVYLRNPFTSHLHRLKDYEREQWIAPEHALSYMTGELKVTGESTKNAEEQC